MQAYRLRREASNKRSWEPLKNLKKEVPCSLKYFGPSVGESSQLETFRNYVMNDIPNQKCRSFSMAFSDV